MRGILSELGLKPKKLQDQVSEEPAPKRLTASWGGLFALMGGFFDAKTRRGKDPGAPGHAARNEEKEYHENTIVRKHEKEARLKKNLPILR
ncbi:MAG: hypothetical protein K8T91_01185 [Planctomycetes bacterium]|nr:hypothetical protein [Planctomycetota bacterium]